MKRFIWMSILVIFVGGFFYPEQADRVLQRVSRGLSQLWWKGHIVILDITKIARKAPCHKGDHDNDEAASFDRPDRR